MTVQVVLGRQQTVQTRSVLRWTKNICNHSHLMNLFDVFELVGLLADVSGPSRYDTESGNNHLDSIKILLAVWQVWHKKVQRNIYGDLDEMETACQCLIKRDRTIAWMPTAHDIMIDWNSTRKLKSRPKWLTCIGEREIESWYESQFHLLRK